MTGEDRILGRLMNVLRRPKFKNDIAFISRQDVKFRSEQGKGRETFYVLNISKRLFYVGPGQFLSPFALFQFFPLVLFYFPILDYRVNFFLHFAFAFYCSSLRKGRKKVVGFVPRAAEKVQLCEAKRKERENSFAFQTSIL